MSAKVCNFTNILGNQPRNDDGSSWKASCNIYGSPGSEPLQNCTSVCDITLCEANGASGVSVASSGESCDCDAAPHYYADGCSCQLGMYCIVYCIQYI